MFAVTFTVIAGAIVTISSRIAVFSSSSVCDECLQTYAFKWSQRKKSQGARSYRSLGQSQCNRISSRGTWFRERRCDDTPLAGQRQIQMERSLTPVSERVGVRGGRKQEKSTAIIASHNVLPSRIFATADLNQRVQNFVEEIRRRYIIFFEWREYILYLVPHTNYRLETGIRRKTLQSLKLMENLFIAMVQDVEGPALVVTHKLKTNFEKNLGYTYLPQIRDHLATAENQTENSDSEIFSILSLLLSLHVMWKNVFLVSNHVQLTGEEVMGSKIFESRNHFYSRPGSTSVLEAGVVDIEVRSLSHVQRHKSRSSELCKFCKLSKLDVQIEFLMMKSDGTEKFSPAPGFEPGFSALRADALSTKPIQPRRRLESSQIKLHLLGSSSGRPLHYVIDVYERRTEVHTCVEVHSNEYSASSYDERVMERRKFSPAPGFEPGFSALRADALSTKPRRIQPRRRLESSQIKLHLLGVAALSTTS
ncbi:hypothetical protein ANN_09143 [Periplaneta americana]|uniref:Uncharacterized protein n=1 Tax=Periplaneta americana TaxID=6978 RepID=A0ABQ8TMA7_PERAM|nr:hypothetical protein ANN_09143 [Periplaneta americana]